MNVLPLALGLFGTNCYVVWERRGEEALLVDCAGTPDEILSAAARQQVRLTLVVLTHGHMDHTERLAELVERTGAQVAVHELDAPMLGDPMLNGTALFGYPHADVTPGRLLRDGDTVSVPGVTLTVHHTPGHTPGSVCLSGGSVIFSGDTLFAGGVGRVDLPGGDEAQMRASLARLLALPDETVVYPGHGPETTIGKERHGNRWLGNW